MAHQSENNCTGILGAIISSNYRLLHHVTHDIQIFSSIAEQLPKGDDFIHLQKRMRVGGGSGEKRLNVNKEWFFYKSESSGSLSFAGWTIPPPVSVSAPTSWLLTSSTSSSLPAPGACTGPPPSAPYSASGPTGLLPSVQLSSQLPGYRLEMHEVTETASGAFTARSRMEKKKNICSGWPDVQNGWKQACTTNIGKLYIDRFGTGKL